jgi:hypothetical protein
MYILSKKFGDGQKEGHHCCRKNKNIMLEARGSVNRQNCVKIGLSSGCSAKAVRDFEETAAGDATVVHQEEVGWLGRSLSQ